jgi:hypothetical protein
LGGAITFWSCERDAAGLEAKYTYDAYAPEGKVTRCQWSDGQFWTFDYEARWGASDVFTPLSDLSGKKIVAITDIGSNLLALDIRQNLRKGR